MLFYIDSWLLLIVHCGLLEQFPAELFEEICRTNKRKVSRHQAHWGSRAWQKLLRGRVLFIKKTLIWTELVTWNGCGTFIFLSDDNIRITHLVKCKSTAYLQGKMRRLKVSCPPTISPCSFRMYSRASLFMMFLDSWLKITARSLMNWGKGLYSLSREKDSCLCPEQEKGMEGGDWRFPTERDQVSTLLAW